MASRRDRAFIRSEELNARRPSEEGIRQDAQTALDYLLKHEKIDSERIILYGQSIGGAVAIDLAARNLDRIAGVIVENTFESLVRRFRSST